MEGQLKIIRILIHQPFKIKSKELEKTKLGEQIYKMREGKIIFF